MCTIPTVTPVLRFPTENATDRKSSSFDSNATYGLGWPVQRTRSLVLRCSASRWKAQRGQHDQDKLDVAERGNIAGTLLSAISNVISMVYNESLLPAEEAVSGAGCVDLRFLFEATFAGSGQGHGGHIVATTYVVLVGGVAELPRLRPFCSLLRTSPEPCTSRVPAALQAHVGQPDADERHRIMNMSRRTKQQQPSCFILSTCPAPTAR
jgi:hypothetical protein